ncbi:hypothetical protein U1Q18_001623 [Sarracenia purpurea var. burkii]
MKKTERVEARAQSHGFGYHVVMKMREYYSVWKAVERRLHRTINDLNRNCERVRALALDVSKAKAKAEREAEAHGPDEEDEASYAEGAETAPGPAGGALSGSTLPEQVPVVVDQNVDLDPRRFLGINDGRFSATSGSADGGFSTTSSSAGLNRSWIGAGDENKEATGAVDLAEVAGLSAKKEVWVIIQCERAETSRKWINIRCMISRVSLEF